jgi:hypothetical protein
LFLLTIIIIIIFYCLSCYCCGYLHCRVMWFYVPQFGIWQFSFEDVHLQLHLFFLGFAFPLLLQFCIVNVFFVLNVCVLFVIHTFLMYFLFWIICWLCCKSQIVMDDQVFILLMILIMLVINMVQKIFIEANLMSLICYEANNVINPKQISNYMYTFGIFWIFIEV